jgi:eukaryotic-like serine/threonine-protein kinase
VSTVDHGDRNGDRLEKAAAERIGIELKDKWTLEAVLGVGGMATVYEATHRNGKRVAIKMLHAELSFDESARRRFIREGYVANGVSHRGAVSVDDDDVAEDGSAFLVMELLEGRNLDEHAEEQGGALPLGEVLDLGDELLDVLAAAHDQGIVHRDIKPNNLFITDEGRLKVLDFGIARVRSATNSWGSTAAGLLLGTPHFMAPEQARGRNELVGPPADVWSVGATLLLLLTGRLVQDAVTVSELIAIRITEPVRPAAELAPGLPAPVCAALDRALRHSIDERYAHARDMQYALRDARRMLSADALATSFKATTLQRRRPNDAPTAIPARTTPLVDDAPASVTLARAKPREWKTTSHGLSHATPSKGESPRRGRAVVGAALAVCVGFAGAVALMRSGGGAIAMKDVVVVAQGPVSRMQAAPPAPAVEAPAAPSISVAPSAPRPPPPLALRPMPPPGPVPAPPAPSRNPYNRRQ